MGLKNKLVIGGTLLFGIWLGANGTNCDDTVELLKAGYSGKQIRSIMHKQYRSPLIYYTVAAPGMEMALLLYDKFDFPKIPTLEKDRGKDIVEI